MAFGGVSGTAVRRTDIAARPNIGSARAAAERGRFRAPPLASPTNCQEVDCVRHLLPRRVIAAAEARAQSIGLGADQVLICADALTEDAYLTALAASLGTSFEPLDQVARTACPLDDHQLIQAAATGLLPLREDGEIVWIIAPRCLTPRRLAGDGRPEWLRAFRFTSTEPAQSVGAGNGRR